MPYACAQVDADPEGLQGGERRLDPGGGVQGGARLQEQVRSQCVTGTHELAAAGSERDMEGPREKTGGTRAEPGT